MHHNTTRCTCMYVHVSTLNQVICSILSIHTSLTHVHPHTYMHMHIHTYVHMYIHTCTCTYVHAHAHTYIRTHVHTYMHMHIRTCTCTYVHTYTCTYIHAHAHMYMYIQAHTRTHTCIHTHTHIPTLYTRTTSPTVLDGSAALSRGAIRPDATTVVVAPSPSIHAPQSPPSSRWGLTELLSTTPGSFGGGKGGGGGVGGHLLPSMGREKREWAVDPIGPCGPGSDFVSLNTVLEWV